MKLESVINLVEESFLDLGSINWLSIYEAVGAAKAPAISYGVAPGATPNSYRLAIRSNFPVWAGMDVVAKAEKRAKGECDIRVTGTIRAPRRIKNTAQNAALTEMKERMRPLRAGYSIGHHEITAGTLGTFVKTKKGIMILSNNHVLAKSNMAKLGDAILQPGAYDGGVLANDSVGNLVAFKKIVETGNVMDAAIASIDKKFMPTDFTLPGIGKIKKGNVQPVDILGEKVKKVGRTTGLKIGKVSAINLRGVKVSYHHGTVCSFDNQIEVVMEDGSGFSAGGDSGSFVVSGDNQPVGLLFAGSDTHTIISPIEAILKEFGAEIIL